ncbi:MAG: hypothetical protein GEV06_20280 [Luteitalea sp.]|nr:hypothetical protein [Luteitalea sp.]
MEHVVAKTVHDERNEEETLFRTERLDFSLQQGIHSWTLLAVHKLSVSIAVLVPGVKVSRGVADRAGIEPVRDSVSCERLDPIDLDEPAKALRLKQRPCD